MSLIINEIFYSLQGEGKRAGEASIFIRLTKCNLVCSFCDTDFEKGKEMTLNEIYDSIRHYECRWIIWTGGEPSIQLNDDVISFFKEKGYMQAIETNGSYRLPKGLDYIACSPKQKFKLIKDLIPKVNELRFPIKEGDKLPSIDILPQSNHYLISPIFDGQDMIARNLSYCVALVKENPQWELSLQIHKLIDIE